MKIIRIILLISAIAVFVSCSDKHVETEKPQPRKAESIYDITFEFCRRFLQKGDRTIDQMVQAARSGKQNIVEGCTASLTSSET